jgi:protein SCO1/2
MDGISRRSLFSLNTSASVAGTAQSAAAPAGSAAHGAQPTKSELARQRIQRLHLPNVPLVTHEGKPVMFYDDLVKGKVVTFNFFYTKCDEICPMVTHNLSQVQQLFGADFGTRLFMYSLTLKPQEDDVAAIRNYRDLFHGKPGWTFLTGEPEHLEVIRRGIGFQYPDPAIDQDKTQHIGNIRYGNEPLMLWAACPGSSNPPYLAEAISWVLRPNTNRIQPS